MPSNNYLFIGCGFVIAVIILYFIYTSSDKKEGFGPWGGKPDVKFNTYSIDRSMRDNGQILTLNLIDPAIRPRKDKFTIISSKDSAIVTENTQTPMKYTLVNPETYKRYERITNKNRYTIDQHTLHYNENKYYIHTNPDNTRIITTGSGLIIAKLREFDCDVLDDMATELKELCMMAYLF